MRTWSVTSGNAETLKATYAQSCFPCCGYNLCVNILHQRQTQEEGHGAPESGPQIGWQKVKPMLAQLAEHNLALTAAPEIPLFTISNN